ncbi:protein tramtrack, beta isoform-like [Ornithodoros turicata]|uniref:protein tramtrack, beta isoform-like n=1 Tax=Ornithodoros turicata TaxID=34597 RepID=UPI0031392AAF
MGGLAPQQFCLKWNNHQSNLVSVVDELYAREAFVDVTLVCEGRSVKAHKVVLSACSPVLQALFTDNPCAHPIIIMNQTRLLDLNAIIEFMYRGSVNVSQDQLPTLLQTAETLKVKGLAEVSTTECVCPATNADVSTPSSPQVKKTSPSPQKRKHTPPPQPRRHIARSDTEDSSPRTPSDHDSMPAKSRTAARQSAPASRRTFDHSYSDDKTNWVPPDSERNSDPGPSLGVVPAQVELDRALSSVSECTPDRISDMSSQVLVEGTMCRVCSRVFSSKGNLKRHMLMHRPYRPKHQCNICLKLFSWPGDLRTHIRVVHHEGGRTDGEHMPLVSEFTVSPVQAGRDRWKDTM